MSVRVGINGFGRMGRLALRAAWDWPDYRIVHVNEVKGGAATAAHLLAFDSVHGRWSRPTTVTEDAIQIDGRRVGFTEHPEPGAVPWGDLGVDVVIECSGKFRTPESLRPYFNRGVKKVIVAAPVKTGALNVVVGCNDHLYDPQEHHLLTAASCTTNCLAPVVKVVHEGLGIAHGAITTLHDVTNTQVVVDAPHKDLRRARSALTSLIPTTTGSATAISLIYPELAGKLNGIAVRVPLLNASLTDCVFEVKWKTTVMAELPGIVNVLLPYVRRIRECGYPRNADTVAVAEEQKKENNNVLQFADCLKRGDRHFIRRSDLFDAYTLWCRQSGTRPVPNNIFGRRLMDALKLTAEQKKANPKRKIGADSERVYEAVCVDRPVLDLLVEEEKRRNRFTYSNKYQYLAEQLDGTKPVAVEENGDEGGAVAIRLVVEEGQRCGAGEGRIGVA